MGGDYTDRTQERIRRDIARTKRMLDEADGGRYRRAMEAEERKAQEARRRDRPWELAGRSAKAVMGFIIGAFVAGIAAVVVVFILVTLTLVPSDAGTVLVAVAAGLGGLGFAWYVTQ